MVDGRLATVQVQLRGSVVDGRLATVQGQGQGQYSDGRLARVSGRRTVGYGTKTGTVQYSRSCSAWSMPLGVRRASHRGWS